MLNKRFSGYQKGSRVVAFVLAIAAVMLSKRNKDLEYQLVNMKNAPTTASADAVVPAQKADATV